MYLQKIEFDFNVQLNGILQNKIAVNELLVFEYENNVNIFK